MDQNLAISILKSEFLPTVGCTEPGAVALAAAYAAEILNGRIAKIEVTVTPNVYKNSVAVGIPGTGETGLYIAAALGALKRNPENSLAVLADVSSEELAQARELVAAGKVIVNVDKSKECLWIQAKIDCESGWSEVIIRDMHTNVVSIKRNGQEIWLDEQTGSANQPDSKSALLREDVTIVDIVETVGNLPMENIDFLLECVQINVHAAEVGIANKLGMGIGAMYEELLAEGTLANDMSNYAKKITAAAADARMSGELIRVVSCSGSGNHGITCMLPVFAAAKILHSPRESLGRAIALSGLVTVYVKARIGNLSALCGCAVGAATGATAAVTWLMGGDIARIKDAMNNVIANLTGMLCDGGKVGCALKLSTAAGVAIDSAFMALRGIAVPVTNGIIGNSVEQTIENLGKISNPGMVETDRVILEVILGKEAR